MKKTCHAGILAALFFSSMCVPAHAVNEGYNPRRMEEANKLSNLYEVEIAKGAATVQNYEGVIRGLNLRKEAYFAEADAAETNKKIYETYKKILQIDRNHYESNVETIDYEIKSGKFDGHSQKLSELIKNEPARYKCRLLKGLTLFYEARFDEAILEITKGISLMPPEMAEKEKAEFYKKVLANSNKYAAIVKKIPADDGARTAPEFFEMARIYLDRDMAKFPENVDKGVAQLKKCIEKDPKHAEAYVLLAETLAEKKQEFKEAMNLLREVDKITEKGPLSKKARNLMQKYYRQNIYLKKKK